MRTIAAVLSFALLCLISPRSAGAVEEADGRVWLDTLDPGYLSQAWGHWQMNRSTLSNKLSVGGKTYERGIGTHALSEWNIDLGHSAKSFHSLVGVDDEVGTKGSVDFRIYLDGKLSWNSGIMHGGEPAKEVNLPLSNARRLTLMIEDAGDNAFDHADWLDAYFTLSAGGEDTPCAVGIPTEPSMPIADVCAAENGAPSIHYPRIIGATPGRPFLFLIPATGAAPLRFEATNLPPGLKLDPGNGVISGMVQSEGRTDVLLAVKNGQGAAQSHLTIVAGAHKLSLTPPMGWNSWNVWAATVDDGKIRSAADVLLSSGLARHGYQFVNIDDGWEGVRTADGVIEPNGKFPDMKALADYVHAKGLKIGIYSSPGPQTCQHLEGSYKHEQQDAETFARWGVDYLKYDLCSYKKMIPEHDEAHVRPPYELMGHALDSVSRDIVYSLCEYGFGDVWKWGAEVGGNCWRTTDDIGDAWGTVTSLGFNENHLEEYAGPGHWNDPDMLVVGNLGMGWGAKVHPTRLTPNEQITHITLWSMLSAPLLLGCDPATLDRFTKNLLMNDEVLSVNQDPLGKQAWRAYCDGPTEVWTRPLEDGSTAVALFNRSIVRTPIKADWSRLALKGTKKVRDLWAQRDLGVHENEVSLEVPAHGAALLKIADAR